MKIIKSVYEEMVSIPANIPFEIGGIIGGDKSTVSVHYRDRGLHTDKVCSYFPDVLTLNRIIDEWAANGISFMGMYHTHFNDVSTLSEGDIKYINRIMLSMPENVDRLFFPLLVLPSRKIVSYLALNNSGTIIISKDDIEIVCEGGQHNEE